MKLAALASLLLPGMAFAAWTTPDFPAFTEEGTGRFISQNEVAKGTRPLQINFGQQCWQPAGAGIHFKRVATFAEDPPLRGGAAAGLHGQHLVEFDRPGGLPALLAKINL